MRGSVRTCSVLVLLTTITSSCSRSEYREDADEDVHAVLGGTTRGTPWELPAGFGIVPAAESRLHDPSDPDSPELPDPGPFLYSYEFPPFVTAASAAAPVPPPPRPPVPPEGDPPSGTDDAPDASTTPPVEAATVEDDSGARVQPIPDRYWSSLPRVCLARMIEFDSVRAEYRRQFAEEALVSLVDPAPQLSLRDIVHLALLDSREYQAAKEQLYSAALGVTLERYDYDIKFSPGANGADADYTITRDDGRTSESLGVFSALQADKMLATGGSLLARFANSVVLTFGGPEGFSRDVSSEILFEFSQSIFQRDLALEPLIRSERELVYAARDYARFRKEFFFSISSIYYGILSNYRNIEIESQNYFSLIRTFEQAQAEVRSAVKGAPNQVAVDQFEQGMLSGRSSLISSCNRLEQALDNLKLQLGMPTETPINIDLSELERLTLGDAAEVAAERVTRWRDRLANHRAQDPIAPGDVLNSSRFLLERFLEWIELRERLQEPVPDVVELERKLGRIRVEEARLVLELNRAALASTQDPSAPAPTILIFRRTDGVVESLLELATQQLALADILAAGADTAAIARRDLEDYSARLGTLRERLGQVIETLIEEQFQRLLEDARVLVSELEALVDALDALVGTSPEGRGDGDRAAALVPLTDELLDITGRLLDEGKLGLPPVDIGLDDAMATALVQRFDLMNERGRLADDRRRVKLAADDLKSILNLGASQSFGTRDNQATKFSLDNSQTSVALTLDLPLNRRAQRNRYRQALIDYHAGRRSLMALEDSIKFDVRDGLRTLEETRIQYPINVTRAALAAEQVASTRLQLKLGAEGVRGTDLLDALQSSREALILVANDRIGYIVDRAGFVLDLELMQLDASGFWQEISDTDYQPTPDRTYPEDAGPTYGTIPPGVWVSGEIRDLHDAPLPGIREVAGGVNRSGAPRSGP